MHIFNFLFRLFAIAYWFFQNTVIDACVVDEHSGFLQQVCGAALKIN